MAEPKIGGSRVVTSTRTHKTFVVEPKGKGNMADQLAERIHALHTYAANTPRLVSIVSPMPLNAVQTDSQTDDKEERGCGRGEVHINE